MRYNGTRGFCRKCGRWRMHHGKRQVFKRKDGEWSVVCRTCSKDDAPPTKGAPS